MLSEEESVGAPQFSQEELNALVEEAHMWEKRVAAHAHGTEGIKRAIKAGVTSVEHASFIDDEGIRLAKEKGTWLVMDIYNDDYILAEFAKKGYPQKIIEKERLVGRTQRENFRKAVQAGAKMAFGIGRRRLPARLERQAVRQDGRVGHDADAGHRGRDRPTRPSCWDGATGSGRSRPASSPT